MSNLVGKPEDRFSRVVAQIMVIWKSRDCYDKELPIKHMILELALQLSLLLIVAKYLKIKVSQHFWSTVTWW